MFRKMLLIVFTILACNFCCYAQDFELEPIIVTGTRFPTEFYKVPRRITVIDSAQISEMKAGSLAEVLNSVSGVDIQERGGSGMQADITMRGSTFQQVLVLVDGVRISDPQTAHHIMNLPLTLDVVDRIEVLHGQGSSIYGPDAFGGVINIVTKQPGNKILETRFAYGSYGTWDGSVSLGGSYKAFSGRVSIDAETSDGFMYDRDFNVVNFYTNLKRDLNWGWMGFSYGVNNKEFGANGFYGPSPSREWTRTKLEKLEIGINAGEIVLEERVYYRRNDDKFIYDIINTPQASVNYHTTKVYGNDFQARFKNLVVGNEIAIDSIESTNLGSHSTCRIGLYSEYLCTPLNLLDLNVGVRGDYHSVYGLEWSPSLNMGCRILSNLRLRSSIGRAFRAPSFTELYYSSPSSKGDPNLKAENNWSYDAGVDWFPYKWLSASATFFIRDEKNVIDWAYTDTLPFQAQNIGQLVMRGIEAEANFSLKPLSLSLGYSYINSQSTTSQNYISKYALRYPEHQATVKVNHPLILNVYQSWQGVLKQRVGEPGYFLLSSAISREIGNIEVFLKGTNLLNIRYEEIYGVAGPGVWIWGGIKFSK